LALEKERLELEIKFQQENLRETKKRIDQKSKDNKHLNHLINQQIIFYQNYRQQTQQEKENLQTKNINLKHKLEQANETPQHKFQKVRAEAKKWKQKTQASQEELANSQTTIFTLEQQLAAEKQAHQQTKQKLASKEQKITDLTNQLAEKDRIIAELKNKPPIQPTNSPNKSENNPSSQNFLTERTQLLNTIQQKETVIQQLKIKLQQATNQPPTIKEIVKEIPVEDLTLIQRLRTELKAEQQKLTQWRCYFAVVSGVSLILLVGLVRVIIKKRKLKKT
jgi:hypothetical protein